jgi:hypothetical protein
MSNTSIKLFEDIMAADKDTRVSAEAKLNELKSVPLSVGLPVFRDGMSCDKPVVSQLATLLLKKTYLDEPEILKVLTPDQLGEIKSLLLENLNFQKEWKTLQRIGEGLAKIYGVSDLRASFTDIMTWFNDENPVARQFAIFIIEVLCDYKVLKDDVVKESVNDFHGIFQKGLLDGDVKVRVSSLKAITQFLTNLNKDLIMSFSSLTGAIIDTLIYALKNDEDKGKLALESLNNLTESHPKFWKDNLETLLHVLYEIIKEKGFSFAIRESSLEIIYTLANKTPAFMRKSNNFNGEILPLLFDLLLDINHADDLEGWNKLTEEEENDLEHMLFSVRDGFSRLSFDLGGKYLLEISTPFIKRYLAGGNWIEQHAAFNVIGHLSEACKDLYKSNIVDLLQYISNGLVHEHVRVKYAALTALAFLLEDTAPLIQKKYHSNVLPAICKLMQESNLRLTTQACSTLVNFLRGLVNKESEEDDTLTEIIKPYAGELLQFLTTLFEKSISISHAPLQEETLTNLSLLATVLDKDFAPYYNQIMPGLKQILYHLNPTTPQQETLKSHAIETISYLCSSVSENSQNFIDDFKDLTLAFGKLLVTLKEEDPQVIAILNGFTHISTSLKEHFYPYLEDLFPILEKYINTDIDFKLEDADIKEFVHEDEANERISMIVNLGGLENKKISLNTHALQNKIMAMNVLYEISLNMNTTFYPYIGKYLNITKKFLNFAYSRKIRKLACKSLFTSILACSNDEQRKEVFDFIGADVLGNLTHVNNSKLFREIKNVLKVLIETCDEVQNANIFNETFIKDLFNNLKNSFTIAEEHKSKIKEQVKAEEGFDENDEDIIENDFDTLNEIIRRVMELSGILFKLYKAPLTEIIKSTLFDLFIKAWDKAIQVTRRDQEYLNCLCFFDDYITYSSQEDFNNFYKTFIQYATAYETTNEDIIQSIVWGFGSIAQRVPKDKWAEVETTVLGTINTILKRNVTEDNGCTFDNAVGALGKAIYYQTEANEKGYVLASQFLSLLPVKNDLEESENIVKLLLQELLNNNPILNEPNVMKEVKEAIKRINEYRTKEEEILDTEGLALLVTVVQTLGLN